MRKNRLDQLPLATGLPDHPLAKELAAMSAVLDREPTTIELVLKDLIRDRRPHTGNTGLTGEQVLRCAVLMRLLDCTYRDLAFHLADSDSCRWFARLPLVHSLRHTTLQSNIRRIRPSTWEAINLILVRHAAQEKIEKGRVTRTDTTVVTNAIHHPTDSQLLWDCVRVLTRLLIRARESGYLNECLFVDHRRAAKRRMMEILNASRERTRRKAYRKLLALCQQTVTDAIRVGTMLCPSAAAEDVAARRLLNDLDGHIQLAVKVMSQTWRRVIHGEQVPAPQKIVSIFEPHTDIIVKGSRETLYGHKVTLTTGRSSMILDCVVEKGNPADSTLFHKSLVRQREIYGRYPRQVTMDGGFASLENLAFAKGEGIKDVVFSKKRGLRVLEMASSEWVYRKLRDFRAGVEGCISALKRICGLGRCTWRRFEGFASYVHVGVVTFNLLVIARHLLA